ncbi:MAG: class I SAM-dependent methyltransferase [Fluviicola sp.]|jgi:2-polyprenyl-3-methyl-5-hydroxy-6-metoxy-1,4-benzoquinol methylase|nr:class I SAM-dependent methyltransferase [Fluviicola sp.]
MENQERKKHWENIYQTKQLNEVSWYQPVPQTSLDLISKYVKSFDAKIIDIGGGDSFLVDHLIKLGYTNISVLDISEAAIERAKIRLGENANKVSWIVSDISKFEPTEKYDFWHDRAAFHFLTNKEEIQSYVQLVQASINSNGILSIGTFSENGPLKCSGIEITQYTEDSLSNLFTNGFEKIESFLVDHPTPFDTVQNFVFGVFRKDI